MSNYMTREERSNLYKEIRRALKKGASIPTMLAMLDSLPFDSEKALYFRKKLEAECSKE
tara:strand:- start:2042 stop:2218 length:177 start_codon:yes stop_codon:yes gene_type:complete